MYDVRRLEGGLELFIDPGLPITDDGWIAHAYVDGSPASGLRSIDLKVLKLLTDTPERLLTTDRISETHLGPREIPGVIHRLREFGLARLDEQDRKRVIETRRLGGYIYKGKVERSECESLPTPSERIRQDLVETTQALPPQPVPSQVEGKSWSRSLISWLVALVLLVMMVVYLLVRDRQSPALASAWRLQVIHRIDQGRETIWRHTWMDIAWLGQNDGWLCGAIVYGGGEGDIGKGVLLHTTDGGISWTQVEKERFHSGAGHFHFGWEKTWEEVGPINEISPSRTDLGGGRSKSSYWVAAESGVYRSTDDGQTWERSTPRPDDLRYRPAYAHFKNLLAIVTHDETYAVGWQGISHWSSAKGEWDLQFPAGAWQIRAVVAIPSDPHWDVWAVGGPASLKQNGPRSADNIDQYACIYHWNQSLNAWERLRVTGVEFDARSAELGDIIFLPGDYKTGFAVGPLGTIVKGSKHKDGTWSWTGIPSPTRANLNSIALADHTLWIVGEEGTVLKTDNLGKKWETFSLKDQSGRPSLLTRVRCIGHSVWIVGDGVVYKYSPEPSR